jgi:hypothetical protein
MEKMSLDQKQKWIIGEEYGLERIRLINADVPDDAPAIPPCVSWTILRGIRTSGEIPTAVSNA